MEQKGKEKIKERIREEIQTGSRSAENVWYARNHTPPVLNRKINGHTFLLAATRCAKFAQTRFMRTVHNCVPLVASP